MMQIKADPLTQPAAQEAALTQLRDILDTNKVGTPLNGNISVSDSAGTVAFRCETKPTKFHITLEHSSKAARIELVIPRGRLNLNELGMLADDGTDLLLCRQRIPNKSRAAADVTDSFFEAPDPLDLDRFVVETGDKKRVYYVLLRIGKGTKVSLEDLNALLNQENSSSAVSPSSVLLNARPFDLGEVYNRRADIHAKFGGQQQGGISTPSSSPLIFLFTGELGDKYGYKDGLREDGRFEYTGEGQIGDMEFKRGNAAILNHARDGKDLLLFEALPFKGRYRFRGNFMLES